MKKSIIINGTPFYYESEDTELTLDNVKPISQQEGAAILKITRKLLTEKNITFYLSFGTLLGAVRDKAIIKGDQDVDVFITDEESLIENLPYFYENGLKIIRIHDGDLYSFRVNESCYIDIYILREPTQWPWKKNYVSLNGWIMPKRYFEKFDTIFFLDDFYNCPANPESLLSWWYGNDWRIPKSSKGTYEVWSSRMWKLLLYYKNRIKRMFIQ